MSYQSQLRGDVVPAVESRTGIHCETIHHQGRCEEARGRAGTDPVGEAVEKCVSFDGVSLAYQQWAGNAELPPVVLLHRFGADSALTWIPSGVVGALVRAGRTVVALDARGHGGSDTPHGVSHYGERTMARDVSVLVDELKVDAVDLLGYGMGAIVAVLNAVADTRVRRLVAGGAGVVEVGGVDTRVWNRQRLLEALRLSAGRLSAGRLSAGRLSAGRGAC
ncbi:alpha/beta fold hydrolase [Cryptosporangium sp. NPDC051539]|uniref:alpha/beta fold hydrolase n=1 Tax=Cryptosporangium sp. NPDC051539 TaxID=3363962 RepID=UPI003799DBCD